MFSLFQCKKSAGDIQENVLRTLYELQNNNKILQKCKTNHEQASKKFDVGFNTIFEMYHYF